MSDTCTNCGARRETHVIPAPAKLEGHTGTTSLNHCSGCGATKVLGTRYVPNDEDAISTATVSRRSSLPASSDGTDTYDRITLDQPVAGGGALSIARPESNATPEETKARRAGAKAEISKYKATRKAQNEASVKQSAEKRAATPTGRFEALKAAIKGQKPAEEAPEDETN